MDETDIDALWRRDRHQREEIARLRAALAKAALEPADHVRAEIAGTDAGHDPFFAAVQATRMPMVVSNPRLRDNPIVFVNQSFCRLTGYRREEILGRNCRFLQGPETDPASVARIRAAIEAPAPIEIDIRNRRKDGTQFWNRLLMAPVRDGDGELAYFFASQVDVTLERERLAGLETQNAALLVELAGRLHAQKESEDRLRFATEAGRLGVWDLDVRSGALEATPLCADNFGHPRALPFTYEILQAAVHPDDRARRQTAVDHSILTGADYDIDYRVIHRDGTTGWVQVRAKVVAAADGTALRLVGVSLDITARMVAETRRRTLVELGDRLRDLEQPADISQAAAEILGRTLEVSGAGRTIIGGTIAAIAAERDWSADEIAFIGEIAERTRLAVERRRAEHDLRQLAASLEQRVEERTRERDRAWKNARDLQAVVDMDGTLRAVNEAWTTILGWRPEEVVGWHHSAFNHPDNRVQSEEALATAFREGLPPYETLCLHKDGSTRWISWVAASEGGFVYASGRDVTAEKEQAETLRRTEEQLRQAQKMEAVGQLTGGLAHDFNNLLTGISGSLELMQARLAQGRLGEIERYATAAQGAVQRAAALTHRLLAFSRRQTLAPKPTDVDRLVADMADLIRRTVGPAITLDVKAGHDSWMTLVDPPQLENALLNLCINARDAMPEGGLLTIETANEPFGATAAVERDIRPGDYLSLCVMDNGTGMPPDVVAHAFDPFFTTKPIGMGTGLGLSMIYGFAKQSGGTVRIESEVGRGTTICLHLPRHHGPEERPEPAPGAGTVARTAQGESVLVVDDEPSVRMLVVDILREAGFFAIEAEDGVAAMRVLQSGARIDLLVTDVGLPNGMNGRQVADAGLSLRPSLKVLFITGYAENAALGKDHLAPGMRVVTKPFSVETLLSRIEDLLSEE